MKSEVLNKRKEKRKTTTTEALISLLLFCNIIESVLNGKVKVITSNFSIGPHRDGTGSRRNIGLAALRSSWLKKQGLLGWRVGDH